MRSPPSSSRRRRRSRSRCTAPWRSFAGRGRRSTLDAPVAAIFEQPPGGKPRHRAGRPSGELVALAADAAARVRELAAYAPGEDNPALEPLALACFYVVDARRSDAFGLQRLAAAAAAGARARRRGGAPRPGAAGGHGADPRLERAERRAAGVRGAASYAADVAPGDRGRRVRRATGVGGSSTRAALLERVARAQLLVARDAVAAQRAVAATARRRPRGRAAASRRAP